MIGDKVIKKSRRTFTTEFKLEVAQLVIDHGYSVREASKAMDVGKTAVDRWVQQLKKERSGTADHPNALTPDQKKIQTLEKRIKQIELEKEILKKATALLMSDSMNNLR